MESFICRTEKSTGFTTCIQHRRIRWCYCYAINVGLIILQRTCAHIVGLRWSQHCPVGYCCGFAGSACRCLYLLCFNRSDQLFAGILRIIFYTAICLHKCRHLRTPAYIRIQIRIFAEFIFTFFFGFPHIFHLSFTGRLIHLYQRIYTIHIGVIPVGELHPRGYRQLCRKMERIVLLRIYGHRGCNYRHT